MEAKKLRIYWNLVRSGMMRIDDVPAECRKVVEESLNTQTNPFQDGLELTLEKVKELKVAELNDACEKAICSGFTSKTTSHEYDFTIKDQINMTQQYLILMTNPNMEKIVWKTEDKGAIPHTRADFIGVVMDADVFKRSNIEKYWILKHRILQAESVSEVEAIRWHEVGFTGGE